MSKNKEYLKLAFLWMIAVIPSFCVILDLFMSTIQSDPEYGDMVINFDFSIINQLVYFSVWSSIFTSVWGISSLISHSRKPSKKIAWAESENTLLIVVLYQLILFLIFTVTFLVARGSIIGFNTWYKILKSSLEHWILPITLFSYFFLVKRRTKLPIKQFAATVAIKSCILPTIYIVFISLRFLMIYLFAPIATKFTPFPYDEFNPELHPTLYVLAIFASVFLSHPLSVILEITSQKLSNKIPQKFQFENFVEQKPTLLSN